MCEFEPSQGATCSHTRMVRFPRKRPPCHSLPSPLLTSPAKLHATDSFYAPVQPPRQGPPGQVVHAVLGQGGVQDDARDRHDRPEPQDQDVQHSRVAGPQDCVQAVRPVGVSAYPRCYGDRVLTRVCARDGCARHRYASLYFAMAVDPNDNELLTLEVIHRYVETLDKYFGNVCSEGEKRLAGGKSRAHAG